METRDLAGLARTIRGGARMLWEAAADFAYPPACPLCQAPPAAAARYFCGSCAAEFASRFPNRCARCSAPVGPHLDTHRGCIHCRNDRFAFERVVSLGVYQGALRQACLLAKEWNGDRVVATLAELLVEREFSGEPIGCDLIVPIPHHWTDRLLRPHLPPVTLAAQLGRLLRVPWSSHILAKVRRTRPQAELSPTARRANLRGAFRLTGNPRLNGVRILLVDDVLTTGTTAHRASMELKQAGAHVQVAVLARGLGAGVSGSLPSGSVPVVASSTTESSESNGQ